MSPTPPEPTTPQTPSGAGTVTVRYWASARAAASVDHDDVAVDGAVTLAELTARVVAEHPGSRLAEVLGMCSVLVGDRPVGTADHATVLVAAGESVEFLPPFAGG